MSSSNKSSSFATLIIPKSISAICNQKNEQSIQLVVRAKPGAKRSQIVSIDDECIGVQIAAPPREGAANEELIDFISHVLGIRSRCIQLNSGAKSRNKILSISVTDAGEKISTESVFNKLQTDLNS
ncbi:Trimeric intracellular cation channel type B [Sarcoptes scabiei]|nr:Trimeric intracellular cation channel type B [Sarcoptes scabiei]